MDNTPLTNRDDFMHVRLPSGCYFVRWSDAERVVNGKPLEYRVYKTIRLRGEFRPCMVGRNSGAEQTFLREFPVYMTYTCTATRDYVAQHPGGW